MSPNTFTCRHPQTLRISPRAWERDFPHPQASEDVQEAGWAFVEMSLPSQEPPNLNPAAHMFLLLPIHRWNYRRGVTGGDRCPALRPCLPPTGTPASPPTTWQVGLWASRQTSRDTLGFEIRPTAATTAVTCRSQTPLFLLWRETGVQLERVM